MSLKKFNKVFSNDFLPINKINLTYLFEEITSGSYSGMESSLWGSKNHRYNAFLVKQNTEPSLVFHWEWSHLAYATDLWKLSGLEQLISIHLQKLPSSRPAFIYISWLIFLLQIGETKKCLGNELISYNTLL